MMARKPGAACLIIRSASMLQWSRANDGAETARNRLHEKQVAQLQWSRANDGAETAILHFADLAADVGLQWSRANDGAETTCPVSASGASAACFNGAAPMMARKPNPANQTNRTPHRFNGAAPMMARKL